MLNMNGERWIRIFLIVFGAALIVLGLGPVVLSGLGDLLDIGAFPIAAVNFAIVTSAVLLASLGLFLSAPANRRFISWTQHKKLSHILIGTTVLACAALILATTDGAYTTAWSYAKKLEPGPDVSKLDLAEEGHHFARLEIRRPANLDDSIGSIPISWRVWMG